VVAIGRDPAGERPRRGDIHFIDFGNVGGHVIRGPHPAVVVQADRMNQASSTVLLCPMTSRVVHDPAAYVPPYLVRTTRQQTGLDRDGWVKADQVFTRPVASIGPRAGRLNPEAIDRLDEALRFVLDI
jgi:mRNA-degrading endonuclease toxin of MazEF toxin-antitoxin module